MKFYKLFISLMVIAWVSSSCAPTTSKLQGQVFWSVSGREVPVANATVELHSSASENDVTILKAVTDADGGYSFAQLSSGMYMVPLVTFAGEGTSSPCPSGVPTGLGGWIDTGTPVRSSIQMLMAGGRTVDISGLEESAAAAQQDGFRWLGYVTVGQEVIIEAGNDISQDILLECR